MTDREGPPHGQLTEASRRAAAAIEQLQKRTCIGCGEPVSASRMSEDEWKASRMCITCLNGPPPGEDQHAPDLEVQSDAPSELGSRKVQLVFDEIAVKPASTATRLLLSSNALNSKGKWARHEITQFWKPLAAWKAESLRVEPMKYVRVSIGFRYPTNHVRDTHNMSPVLKACLDGVVSAGLIKDDNDNYVESVKYYRYWPNGSRRVVLTLEEVE